MLAGPRLGGRGATGHTGYVKDTCHLRISADPVFVDLCNLERRANMDTSSSSDLGIFSPEGQLSGAAWFHDPELRDPVPGEYSLLQSPGVLQTIPLLWGTVPVPHGSSRSRGPGLWGQSHREGEGGSR